MNDHCGNNRAHCLLREVVQLRIGTDARQAANVVDVTLGVILDTGRPCTNDSRYRRTLVVTYVSTKKYEPSAEPVDHGHKLFKVGIIGVRSLS